MLDITDNVDDEKLFLAVENAMLWFRSYLHSDNLDGLEPLLRSFVGHLITSGEMSGTTGSISQSSSSSSTSGGGVEPTIGELKAVAYSGVREEYTNSSDFVNKSSQSSSNKEGTTAAGDAMTWFMSYIAPALRSRRKIQTISHPWVETSPDRY